MKIFIWEGDGISDAYHDDGTLVVLADTPEEARNIMQKARTDSRRAGVELGKASKKLGYSEPYYWRQADQKGFQKSYDELHVKYPAVSGGDWDGNNKALNREPDQTIELDKPKFIAFNGGGYD